MLGAIGALDAERRLVRTWGRCLSCLKGDRALLMVRASSASRRRSAVKYDGPERHDGLVAARTAGKRLVSPSVSALGPQARSAIPQDVRARRRFDDMTGNGSVHGPLGMNHDAVGSTCVAAPLLQVNAEHGLHRRQRHADVHLAQVRLGREALHAERALRDQAVGGARDRITTPPSGPSLKAT